MTRAQSYGRWILPVMFSMAIMTPKSLLCAEVTSASSSFDSRLPRIKQVAVMPVYWQNDLPDSEAGQRIKKTLDSQFSSITRDSKRFYFANDAITADLWNHPEGRKELAETYEIDAFINLTVKSQNDLMLWTVRFMSPNLENYLVETERVPMNWAAAASPEDLDKKLRSLVFRTLNRYPIDVFVTSIQGAYITLSGGKKQLVFEGDELSFYQTSIKAKHPVDGSWIQFDRKALGKAKIIESHEQSSVAQLTSLAYEDAIKMGDGALVEASATRRAFQKPVEEPLPYSPVSSSPLVVVDGSPQPTQPSLPPPLPSPSEQKKAKSAAPLAPPVNIKPVVVAAPEPEPREQLPSESPDQGLRPEEPIQDEGQDSISLGSIKDLTVVGLSQSFTYSGAASAQSQASSLFLNLFEARTHFDVSPEVEILGELGLATGKTSKGDYSGFHLRGEPLYKVPALSTLVPSLDRILVGASIYYQSIGVTKQTFGGWDIFVISPSLHAQGSAHFPDEKRTIDFDGNLKFALLPSGNAGIRGKKRDLQNLALAEWEISASLRSNPHDISWGAILNNSSGSAKAGTKTLKYESMAFGVTAKLKL